MKKTRLRPVTRKNGITYSIVLLFYVVIQILTATGSLSSLFKGLLIPVCVYVILAVSLNLTVGVLGELSLGHAGFMCVGAYASSIFSISTQEVLTSVPAGVAGWRPGGGAVRRADRFARAAVAGRLSGNRNTGLW